MEDMGNDNQRIILEFLLERGPSRPKEIAEGTGLNYGVVRTTLSRMKKRKLVFTPRRGVWAPADGVVKDLVDNVDNQQVPAREEIEVLMEIRDLLRSLLNEIREKRAVFAPISHKSPPDSLDSVPSMLSLGTKPVPEPVEVDVDLPEDPPPGVDPDFYREFMRPNPWVRVLKGKGKWDEEDKV